MDKEKKHKVLIVSNNELLNILNKQWASVYDIQKIGACGNNKARLIRDKISVNVSKDGFNLPIGRIKLVPMKYVIDYFGIDINQLHQFC